VIESFGDKACEDLFHGAHTSRVRRLPHDVAATAVVKLDILNAAHDLNDLRSPPGNRLEALKGKLRGYHSIRVNSQWRIVFKWQGQGAHEVSLVDYHS